MKFETKVIHAGQAPDPRTGAVMTPIYATSTYAQASPGEHKGYEYARTHNPTRDALEACLAALEGGQAASPSPRAGRDRHGAELLDAGDHVVAIDDLYGGTFRIFDKVPSARRGSRRAFVDLTIPGNLETAITPQTKMVWVETPTNPMLKLVDLAAIAAIAKKRELISVCDNTFASPFPAAARARLRHRGALDHQVPQRPLRRGRRRRHPARRSLKEKLAFLQNAVGAVPSPFDCFLMLRGIKTLAVRMERHAATRCTSRRSSRSTRRSSA